MKSVVPPMKLWIQKQVDPAGEQAMGIVGKRVHWALMAVGWG
jgi:hypothetical protein